MKEWKDRLTNDEWIAINGWFGLECTLPRTGADKTVTSYHREVYRALEIFLANFELPLSFYNVTA